MARIWVLFVLLFFVFNAWAQGPKHRMTGSGMPKPLFNRPVKVDSSGKPLYNTWQKQEYERKIRFEQRQMNQDNSGTVPANDTFDSSLYNTNAATSETSTTPSSAITNRPIRIQGDPEQMNEETDAKEVK